ncbi:cytochrome-c peroxidase [Pseudorhodoplanes sp.]|uniref:cytochrome-c peroxidase n=1 Tax=Pseudorhodoplanes sp. TaxID=1934341 RepID=UPI002CF85422|nr:cytochrome c peroxidase [Pseudorhodoplanes sp.]HWV43386.1 cytochrome c peroxidase [Pseudorhodoplanes sp.]
MNPRSPRSQFCKAALAAVALGVMFGLGDRPGYAETLDQMKAHYRRPPPTAPENRALAALGRELFFDPIISASGRTACATCHRPELGFAANEARSPTDSGRPTARKTQTLLGIGHARPPFDWDGRHATLEAQAVSAIGVGSMSMFATPHEVKVDDIIARVRKNEGYVAKFARALPGAPINLDNVVIALAAFERTIEPGIAPFDRWIKGEEAAIPESAKRGFVLFHTRAGCSACHRGWRFTDDQFHDVGSTTTDRGRGRELKHDPKMQFAFKTPTLRSVALRAPYLHDGSARTLREVIALYVKGGIDRDSRSPMINPIDLTEQDRDDLVAFLETLTGEGEAK